MMEVLVVIRKGKQIVSLLLSLSADGATRRRQYFDEFYLLNPVHLSPNLPPHPST